MEKILIVYLIFVGVSLILVVVTLRGEGKLNYGWIAGMLVISPILWALLVVTLVLVIGEYYIPRLSWLVYRCWNFLDKLFSRVFR